MIKRKICFCVFFATICATTFFGQTFQWQATSINANTNNQRFDDVFFLNDDLGWAANGAYAAVYKTTNGGLNWTKQFDENDLGIDLYLRSIVFLNENIGFLGTLNSKLYKTLNGGDTWSEITNISPFPTGICGLDAVGLSTVYGCGAYFEPAYFIKSVDSGQSWTYKDMSTYATALVEVKFISEQVGYAAGKNASGGTILKTSDGGLSWTEIYNSGIAGEYVWKLQVFTNTDIIFGSVYSVPPNPGKLIKTTNAGINWTSVNAPSTDVQAVGFITESHGWMGGHSVGFFETKDGGNTWIDVGAGGNLNRIFVLNETTAFAAGTTVYKYTDQTLNIQENTLAKRKPLTIHLQKNPVSEFLEFSIKFDSQDHILVELYDVKGKLIKKLLRQNVNAATKAYQFSVKELSSGVYILNFHNNTGRQSVKFVKI